MKSIFSRLPFAGALLIALSLPSQALAYIPPSGFIIKNVASKHAGVKGVRIQSQVSALENGKPSATHFKAVTVFEPQGELIRSWAMDDAGQKLYRFEKRGNLSLAETLTLDARANEIARTMKAYGIPVRTEADLLQLPDEEQRRAAEVETMKRWKGTPAWVIGNQSQLWVEKDSFLPVRIVIVPESPGAKEPFSELQFDAFHFFHGFPYPKVITAVGPDHVPFLREDMLEFNVGSVAGDMKGFTGTSSGFTQVGSGAPGPLKELIEKYYQTLK